jgi:prepilin peptidase CpaA
MHLLITIVFVGLMLWSLVQDVRTQRLPNRLTVSALAAGLLLRTPLGFAMIGEGLAGAALGLLVGMALFILGAIGGGDAKLLAAVGAVLGPEGLLAALLASAVVGGVLGLFAIMWRRVGSAALLNLRSLLVYVITFGRAGQRITLDTPGALKVPYGVAIAVGSLAAWFLPLTELWR